MGRTEEGTEVASKRFPIKLPPWHEKRLIWWAACKGTTKTSLAINVVQARIEVNEQIIESMLQDRAADLGISVDELKANLLKKAGFVAPDGDEDDAKADEE